MYQRGKEREAIQHLEGRENFLRKKFHSGGNARVQIELLKKQVITKQGVA